MPDTEANIGVWVRLGSGHVAYLEAVEDEDAAEQLEWFLRRMAKPGMERLSDGRIVNRNYIIECGEVAE